MIDIRLRSQLEPAALEPMVGKVVTEDEFDVLLTGPVTVRKPNGQLLCVYLPGALAGCADTHYPLLTTIRGTTDNRGLASGTERVVTGPAATRTRSMPVMSSIIGAADRGGRFQYCRLTVFTAKQVEEWESLKPLWREIAARFQEYVPDRYRVQAEHCDRTHPDWVVPDTPFTTITINNSYSTGVHTDKGDLDAGFSCLAALRRGQYTGGHIVFPEYRVAADMGHGDLLLMDAHSWHGNTAMTCECGDRLLNRPCDKCGAERISIVCYFRTGMTECGSGVEEDARRLAQVEKAGAAA